MFFSNFSIYHNFLASYLTSEKRVIIYHSSQNLSVDKDFLSRNLLVINIQRVIILELLTIVTSENKKFILTL